MNVRLRNVFPAMILAMALAIVPGAGGCGLFYQAGTRLRSDRIANSLKPGETSLQVHNKWGEPDLRSYPNATTEIWSYAERANTNDVTATLFYTSVKPGDQGKFLDLKFVNSKLVSWTSATRTMPAKQGSGFSYGLGPGGGVSGITHY
ncbi:MAG: hypothetical protein ACREQN_06230 [Candidatus Binataceae bacterium]